MFFLTGYDDDLGYLTAKSLTAKGFKVFVGVTNPSPSDLKTLQELKSPRINVFELYRQDDASVDRIFEEVKKSMGSKEKLWAIVNIPQYCLMSKIEWGSDEGHFKQAIDLDVLGTVRVTRRFLPLIRDSKGRVVSISSYTSKFPFSLIASNSVISGCIYAFTEALRRELSVYGVKSINIEAPHYPVDETSMLQSMENCWKETSQEVVRSYPSNDLQKSLAAANKIAMVCSLNLKQVSESVTECLIAKEPEYNYVAVERVSRLVLWLFNIFVPDEFTQFITRLLQKII